MDPPIDQWPSTFKGIARHFGYSLTKAVLVLIAVYLVIVLVLMVTGNFDTH